MSFDALDRLAEQLAPAADNVLEAVATGMNPIVNIIPKMLRDVDGWNKHHDDNLVDIAPVRRGLEQNIQGNLSNDVARELHFALWLPSLSILGGEVQSELETGDEITLW